MSIRSGLNQKCYKNYLRDQGGISSGIKFVINDYFTLLSKKSKVNKEGLSEHLKLKKNRIHTQVCTFVYESKIKAKVSLVDKIAKMQRIKINFDSRKLP